MLKVLRRWLRLGSLQRGDFARESVRPVDNLDAGTAAMARGEKNQITPGGGYPPGYVKDYDEGRPRK